MAKSGVDYRDRIVRDPEMLVGKPVVKGTRISVETALAHLRDNPDVKDVFESISSPDIRGCEGLS